MSKPVKHPLLFDDLPRRPSRVMMHVIDAGHGDEIDVILQCNKCHHTTGWTVFNTVTEAKRGLPCPNCNKE